MIDLLGRRSMSRNISRRTASSLLALGAAGALVAGCNDPSPETDPLGGPVPTPSESGIQDPAETNHAETGASQEFSVVSVADTIATGLESPWGVAFLEAGSAIVTLRDSGRVALVDDQGIAVLDAGGVDGAVPDVDHNTEDGLLGVAVGPDQSVYLYLTTDSDNRVVRFDLDGSRLVNEEVILAGIPSSTHHNGGRLAFGPDGYLYVTTGDTREPSTAQDTESLAGKILRITAAGEPAAENPFGNEVWSYGHRNVQGIGWTSDGRMYASEFGENDFDELNLIEPGSNYGWPHVEGWAGDPDYVDPLVTWPTSEASPSGIAVTDDGVWVAGLRGERLWYVPFDEHGDVGEPRDYLDLGRLRDVVMSPNDDIWVVTSNTDGRGDPRAEDDRIVLLELT